jgi:transcriptional regulator with XRE-family HTH domain
MKTSEIDRIIGLRLKIKRVLSGLDKAALAERLGTTQQCILEYEAGSLRIDAQTMRSICNALNVNVSYFFEYWNGESYNFSVAAQ